jgi:hypothetical protein
MLVLGPIKPPLAPISIRGMGKGEMRVGETEGVLGGNSLAQSAELQADHSGKGGAGLGMAVNPAKTRASVTLVKGP